MRFCEAGQCLFAAPNPPIPGLSPFYGTPPIFSSAHGDWRLNGKPPSRMRQWSLPCARYAEEFQGQ